jgi:hypothetical protein
LRCVLLYEVGLRRAPDSLEALVALTQASFLVACTATRANTAFLGSLCGSRARNCHGSTPRQCSTDRLVTSCRVVIVFDNKQVLGTRVVFMVESNRDRNSSSTKARNRGCYRWNHIVRESLELFLNCKGGYSSGIKRPGFVGLSSPVFELDSKVARDGSASCGQRARLNFIYLSPSTRSKRIITLRAHAESAVVSFKSRVTLAYVRTFSIPCASISAVKDFDRLALTMATAIIWAGCTLASRAGESVVTLAFPSLAVAFTVAGTFFVSVNFKRNIVS